MKSKLSPSLMKPSPLESKRPHHQSGQVSPSKIAEQINSPGFLSWNIAEEHQKHCPQSKSLHNPAGTLTGKI